MWYRIEVVDLGKLNKGPKLETVYDGPSADTVALSCAQILWPRNTRMAHAHRLYSTLKMMAIDEISIVEGYNKSKLKLSVTHAKES